MNVRERFVATMHYKPRDRAPICDFSFWPETIEAWHQQGLPLTVKHSYDCRSTNAFFGMDPLPRAAPISPVLWPVFEKTVVEDLGDQEIVQQANGVRVRRHKRMSSIPSHEGHLLVDRASWEKHYKPRLDPDNPHRWPSNWDELVAEWTNPDRDYPISVHGGSMWGCLRDWMGLEEVSYAVYDDPAWFEEMTTTLGDCAVGVLERLFATGGKFDACQFWEDMCYNSGPLVGVEHFKKYCVPQYKRITELCRKHGIDVVWVDCDGKIDDLLPHWLDAGVNTMFPVEVGTWNGDPVRYRREYGKELRMMGGFDKHILARDKEDIEREVDRLTPLVEEGGYIGFCDHRVPPDVPLENYMHYLHLVRERWGKGTNLRSMGELDPSANPTSSG
jgi:uroporphyrinogen decarboxylase